LDTISQLFTHAANSYGESKIYGADETFSYRNLELEARRIAQGLTQLGVGPGDRVGFWLPNIKAYIGLLGACGHLGAIAVAMNTRFRKAEIEDVIRRVEPKVIAFVSNIGSANNIDIINEVDSKLLSKCAALIQCDGEKVADISHANVRAYETLRLAEPIKSSLGEPQSPFCIFNTSGTTSLPKFVLHNQQQVVRHSIEVMELMKMKEADTMVLQSLPFCGVFGFIFLLSSVSAGAPFVMPPIFEAKSCAKQLMDFKVTHVAGGDDMFFRLLQEGEALSQTKASPFPALKYCPYASFNSALADFPSTAVERGIPLIAPFGMSEVFSFFSLRHADDPLERKTLGGGFPVNKEAKVRVRDPETGCLLGHEEEGELEVWSPNIFVGYYGDEASTKAAFTDDGFLKTGDLGTTCSDGSFTYLGRMGDVLRLGGFLVNPLEIETFLCKHNVINDAQVVAVPTEKGNKPVAFILREEGAQLDENEIIAYCKRGLAGFKVPICVVEIAKFPTTPSPNGTKIQKSTLRKLAIERLEQV